MRWMWKAISFVILFALVAFADAGAGTGAAQASDAVPGRGALDLAFRFASAIEGDEKDRARAQQVVIEDMMAIGAVDDALVAADRVSGWRRGVVLAELGLEAANAGREAQARSLLDQAEEVRRKITGWENPRIAAYIADGLAALGETERVHGISAQLLAEDDRQYLGRSAAAQAVGSAGRGEFDLAMTKLAALEGNSDYEAALGRTSGYLALARSPHLSGQQREAAAAAARRSADAIPGFKRTEMLESIGERYFEMGNRDAAVEALAAAEPAALATPARAPERAAVLATLAKSWGRIGEKKRAQWLLREAESALPNALNIEQPGILAFVGAGYLEIRDDSGAWRLYDAALGAAEKLVNARPRALSAVEICRSIGLQKADPRPETRTRLEALLRGLKAPW